MATEKRTVLVTGCTRGLGGALAKGFSGAGWRVAGCGRNADAIRAAESAFGNDGLFRAVDVTDAGAVEAFAAAVDTAFGPPHLVVNNAALINANAPLWEVPVGEFSAVVDVNVKGVFHVIRAFVPRMAAAGRGVIVNLSSGWGRSTSPEVAPYCATKWAIEGLTAALAQELPRGLAAVALNPGVIDTDMLRSCFGEGAGAHRSPEQWARTAVPFLAGLGPSDNGRALTAP